MIGRMPDRDPPRNRQRLLSGWLSLTGIAVGLMLALSMYWRLHGSFQASRDWLGYGILTMLLSVYISDIIRGVRRLPEADLHHRYCEHCLAELESLKLDDHAE